MVKRFILQICPLINDSEYVPLKNMFGKKELKIGRN